MSAYNPQDDLNLEDLSYRKKMAVATLNDAINQIYNIEGDRWQMIFSLQLSNRLRTLES